MAEKQLTHNGDSSSELPVPQPPQPSETAAILKQPLLADPLPLFPVVGLGASAGGLEALTEFFHAMPATTGLAFVVVSHLDPGHKSVLSEILSQASSLPVAEVTDGMTVEPNHVYVMPPNRELLIIEGILRLIARPETRAPHMVVDAFFRSLASDRKGQAIGVVLSGTGSDGTLGLKLIKEEGGITFAQNQSAQYGGMPRSAIAAGCVDAVLPPAQIAAELCRVAGHPALARLGVSLIEPGNEDATTFQQILRLLSDSTGVDFVHYKNSTLRRRIERRIVLRRLQTLGDYLRCLREDPAERDTLFEEVLIPVTSFFRDPETFEVLKTVVLPQLLADRAGKTPIRVWVAGCATGEEAYSIAICLLEYLEGTGSSIPVKIFATDISDRAIETARSGAYSEGIATEVSGLRLQRFFLKTDRGYQIAKSVRDLCVFARQDMTKDPPFSQLDMISCRNALIYLGPVLQGRVLPVFHYALKPGGYLLLGSSETVGNFTDLFELTDRKHKFYVRTATPSRPMFDYSPGTPTRARITIQEGFSERTRSLQDLYREADRVVLGQYAPPGVVVDDNLQVVQYRGDTGNYLKPAPGPPSTDLLLMAREGLVSDLRSVIAQARQSNAPANKANVRVRTNDHFQDISLGVVPVSDPVSGARHFLVLFDALRPDGVSLTGASSELRRLPFVGDGSMKDQEINRLKDELEATRAYLQSVIELKDVSNEELRAANEEIISANEELQSTNEELTTAKEELQATNEELTTVNDELQNRIRVANQLGDDLVNLIESTNIPIVVLGIDLCIRRFTPSAQRVLSLRPGDVGRPIGELKLKLNFPDLTALAREVIDTLESRQREITDDAGIWHRLSIRPYKTIDHVIGGVVLMLIDIDAIKQRERQIQESRDYALSILETVRESLIVLDSRMCVRMANRSFYETYQTSLAETEGRLIYEVGNGQWNIPRLRLFLEQVVPLGDSPANFEVEHDFVGLGRRVMSLKAQRFDHVEGDTEQMLLLAIDDISARKQAENEVLRLASIVENCDDAIIGQSLDGVIVSWNAGASRMFSIPRQEAIGLPFARLVPPGQVSLLLETLARIRSGERVHSSRSQRLAKDGRLMTVAMTASPIKDSGGQIVGVSVIDRDITEQEALERQVVEIAAQEEQRIARELHDGIGQELTGLGLLSSALVARLEQGSREAPELATRVANGLEQAHVHLRELCRGLMLTDLDTEGLSVALGELVSRTGGQLGITCRFECPESVVIQNTVTAKHLYRIAQEAISNALRHGRPGEIVVSLLNQAEELLLSVRDDGTGVPAEVPEGMGMGIPIMRYRASAMGGVLRLGPAEGGGTLVVCVVPRRTNHVQV